MIGFDKTVTIYNKRYDNEAKITTWPKTIIHGASWAGCQRVTATADGLKSNDGYSVRIPVQAVPEGFLPQKGDVVVLGEGRDVVEGITEITRGYTDCFTVTAVHTDNMSRLLPHLRLEGR